MIITANNYRRARQILREWRRRGVAYIHVYLGDNGAIANGYGCLPSDSDIPVNEGDKVFPIPSIAELPDSESQIKEGMPIPVAESQMASAISDFWDDPSVPSEDV